MRSFAASELSAAEAYALLVGIVVPRPVAWITTVDLAGAVNAGGPLPGLGIGEGTVRRDFADSSWSVQNWLDQSGW